MRDPDGPVLTRQRRDDVQPVRQLAEYPRRLFQAGGYYTGMIGRTGSDPAGFDHWEILPGQGVYVDPVFYTAIGESRRRPLCH